MSKSREPASPNYEGAAQATAAGNLDAARAAATANRVNQITPQGNLTYAVTGQDSHGNDIWTATQSLSPDQQAIYQGQNNLSKGLLSTAQTGLSSVDKLLGAGGSLDESRLARMPIQGESVQDAVFSRLRPQIDYDRGMLESKLANQGITQGSEAYNNAMRSQSQRENDLYTQAALQGINTGLTARQQGIQEQYAAQDRPLNIVNALRTGSQVSSPQFVNAPQQAATAGPDLLGAAQSTYNSQLGNYNAKQAGMNNLFNLGGSLGSAYLFSDPRLKTNVKRIGTHPLGIGIYSYEYLWGESSIGVMSDELERVMPQAVSIHPSGYKMVNYAYL